MAKVNISILLKDVEIEDEKIKKYDLEDSRAFEDEAQKLGEYLKEGLEYPIKEDFIEIEFELNGRPYPHFISTD